jgi:uncharacterized protein
MTGAAGAGASDLGRLLAQPLFRLLSTPRVCEKDDGRAVDRQRAHVLAALAGASKTGPPIMCGWVRNAPLRPISVLLAGPGLATGTPGEDDQVDLAFPPGSTGRLLPTEEVEPLLAPLSSWIGCDVTFDPDRLTEEEDPWRQSWGSLEETFSHFASVALGWLVVARPAPQAQVQRDMTELALRLPSLRETASSSEELKIEFERLEALYRQVGRSELTGWWSLRIAAGAASAEVAGQVAAMLCNTTELRELPYRLQPCAEPTDLVSVLSEQPDVPIASLAASELVAALTRPPRRELPGIRLVQPPPFDVTPESDGPVRLGDTLDEGLRPCGALTVSSVTLKSHTFVCGATGSGKSQTVRTMLEGASRAGIQWMVLEPAKAEYAAAMAARLDGVAEVLRIRIGEQAVAPASLNPLEAEPGFPLQSHLELVRALFLAAFTADEPFPQVLTYALERCYSERGFDLALSRPVLGWPSPEPPTYPTLWDLQRAAREVVDGIGYGKEITDNVRGFVDVRLGSLRTGTPGRFFEGGHPLDFAAAMSRAVVFEIEDVSSDQDKAFVMGVILIRLYEHLRMQAKPAEGEAALTHLTVIEEAHRLLRHAEPGTSAAYAVELFANLLAEVRAYGEGIVVAEQIPSKILPDLIKNTALKVVHRLPAEDDRRAVGATMNFTEAQSEYVVALRPGRAAVFTDEMDRPVLAAITDGTHRERASGQQRPPVSERAPGAERPPVSERPPLSGRRSGCCTGPCREDPCTLEQIRTAEQLVAECPDLEMWVELVTLAHVTGLPRFIGRPNQRWINDLLETYGTDARLLGCAVALCADRAVAARYAQLRRYYRPDGLAVHVADVVLRLLSPRPPKYPCDSVEPSWQAGEWRWRDVQDALGEAGSEASSEQRLAWRQRGLKLPKGSLEEQLAYLQRRRLRRVPDQRELELGAEPPRIVGLLQSLTGVDQITAKELEEAATAVGLEIDPFFAARVF